METHEILLLKSHEHSRYATIQFGCAKVLSQRWFRVQLTVEVAWTRIVAARNK